MTIRGLGGLHRLEALAGLRPLLDGYANQKLRTNGPKRINRGLRRTTPVPPFPPAPARFDISPEPSLDGFVDISDIAVMLNLFGLRC